MINGIRKYTKVLIRIFAMSHHQAVVYKVDYLIRILRAFLDVAITYIIVTSFYNNISTIAGWNKWDALLVFSFYQIISTFIFIFAGHGISSLGSDIIRGRIDQFLVKPVDAQFLTSVRISYITNVFRVIFGIIMFYIAVTNITVNISFLKILLTIVSIVSAAIIYYSLTFMVSILSFWTYSEELGHLMFNISSIARFPSDFFSKQLKLGLHIFPLVFISTIPAQALLGKSILLPLISPLVAAICFKITRSVWFLGLKSYQSASS